MKSVISYYQVKQNKFQDIQKSLQDTIQQKDN
jgi:hypothetical protein